MGREECEAVICAGCVFDIVDWLCIVEDGNYVDGEAEGEAGDDGVKDFFECQGGGCLVRVCRGGHGNLDDDVLAFVGVVIVIDSAVGGAACLELNVFGASGTLLFEESGDDVGGRLDVFGQGN